MPAISEPVVQALVDLYGKREREKIEQLIEIHRVAVVTDTLKALGHIKSEAD